MADEGRLDLRAGWQELRRTYTTVDGLPSNDVVAVAVDADGAAYALGPDWFGPADPERGGDVIPIEGGGARCLALSPDGAAWIALAGGALLRINERGGIQRFPLPDGFELTALTPFRGGVLAASDRGVLRADADGLAEDDAIGAWRSDHRIRALAGQGDRAALGTADGLFAWDGRRWARVRPMDAEGRRWDPTEVTAAAYTPDGRLVFTSRDGAAEELADGSWRLQPMGIDGFPVAGAPFAAAGADGVYFADAKAIYVFGEPTRLRTGSRWLPPGGTVRGIAAGPNELWAATDRGVGRIYTLPMTLEQKAAHFDAVIEARHVRQGHFVTEVELETPGDIATFRQVDTDNDGLWTSMYGAAQCFKYAVTKDPAAKARARRALDGIMWLMDITSIPGFPARAIRAADGEDPNGYYNADWNAFKKSTDPYWKDILPRWPKSADGRYYWKCDTSSDELDGHYFLYACYYDLAAETDEEKRLIREHVAALTDHLCRNDYSLVDHDGQPTRWAHFGPQDLNDDPRWIYERGLNSLSMLSYLRTAEHITGDAKYARHVRRLVDDHHYHTNALFQKVAFPPEDVNDSDDEMAFMCYYNLLRYETDPELRAAYAASLSRSWRFERGERNPLFNFMYAGCQGLESPDHEASMDTLRRLPLELISWAVDFSQRQDVRRAGGGEGPSSDPWGEGVFQERTVYPWPGVIPIDERIFLRWNENPWRMDADGQGLSWMMEGKPGGLKREGEGLCEYDGTTFLLPYYMGRHHGFIAEA